MLKVNENIKKLRTERSLTLEEFAQKLGMTKSGYHGIERGRSSISIDKLQHIADTFEIDIFDLLGSPTKKATGGLIDVEIIELKKRNQYLEEELKNQRENYSVLKEAYSDKRKILHLYDWAITTIGDFIFTYPSLVLFIDVYVNTKELRNLISVEEYNKKIEISNKELDTLMSKVLKEVGLNRAPKNPEVKKYFKRTKTAFQYGKMPNKLPEPKFETVKSYLEVQATKRIHTLETMIYNEEGNMYEGGIKFSVERHVGMLVIAFYTIQAFPEKLEGIDLKEYMNG